LSYVLPLQKGIEEPLQNGLRASWPKTVNGFALGRIPSAFHRFPLSLRPQRAYCASETGFRFSDHKRPLPLETRVARSQRTHTRSFKWLPAGLSGFSCLAGAFRKVPGVTP